MLYVIKPQEGDADLVITDAKNKNPFTGAKGRYRALYGRF
jgi:hypothetical protein